MPNRMKEVLKAAATASLLGVTAPPAAAAPAYVPTGSDIFEDYTALSEPRADVPVGALWVQDFGPYGEGASPDNLVTVRSVSGLSLNREQNFRLTLGLLSFLNIDPALRSQVSARFADVTIIRVKDVAKLAGPSGEPRIYEALKAGTVTVTLNNELGTDLGTGFGGGSLPASGRAQAGRKRSFTLEGRDLFIAYRVATPRIVMGKAQEVPLRDGSVDLGVGEYRLATGVAPITSCPCTAGAQGDPDRCVTEVEIPVELSKPNGSAAGESAARTTLRNGVATTITLPMPVSDGSGGVFTAISVTMTLKPPAREAQGERCTTGAGPKSRITAAFSGERLETVKSPRGKGW